MLISDTFFMKLSTFTEYILYQQLFLKGKLGLIIFSVISVIVYTKLALIAG